MRVIIAIKPNHTILVRTHCDKASKTDNKTLEGGGEDWLLDFDEVGHHWSPYLHHFSQEQRPVLKLNYEETYPQASSLESR